MRLGIDVGGTFTDAVLADDQGIKAQAKSPTTGDLLTGILSSLDQVLIGLEKELVSHITLSTTIVTNALLEDKLDKTGILLMAGPGMILDEWLPVKPARIDGYIDHRGRVVEKPTEGFLNEGVTYGRNYEAMAVSGKFSVRNAWGEQLMAERLREVRPDCHVTLGSELTGSLNFWRRTNSAYYNAAAWRVFSRFADAMEKALSLRGIAAPVSILKADGGTVPLDFARQAPVETIFTGPAASVMGIMSLCPTERPAVSLDIGGTSTDIALWRKGRPLFAVGGAKIMNYPTSVRTFRLHSIAVGGDSWVRRAENGRLVVGPDRKGPAVCVGGTHPTVTDALVVMEHLSYGDRDKAALAMRELAEPGQGEAEVAAQIVDLVCDKIVAAVIELLQEEEKRPVYRVDDILQGTALVPEVLIGVGGSGEALTGLVAKRMNLAWTVPEYAMVANAVGAAVANGTVMITLRVDTEQGLLSVAEMGIQIPWKGKHLRLPEVREMAVAYLQEKANGAGVEMSEAEVLYEEEFSVVRGFSTVGRIITCAVQAKQGVGIQIGRKPDCVWKN